MFVWFLVSPMGLIGLIGPVSPMSPIANPKSGRRSIMRRMTPVVDAADHLDSSLGRLDARWKLAALVVAIVAAAFARTIVGVLLAGFGACVLLEAARLPAKHWGGRVGGFALFLLPFLVLVAYFQGQYWAAAIIGIRALTLFVLAVILLGSSPMHRNIQAAQS